MSNKNILKLNFILVVLGIGYKVVNYIFDESYRQGFSKAFLNFFKKDYYLFKDDKYILEKTVKR